MKDRNSDGLSAPEAASAHRGMVLFVASLSYFLAGFVTTSVNIGLPAIQVQFRLSASALGWVSFDLFACRSCRPHSRGQAR